MEKKKVVVVTYAAGRGGPAIAGGAAPGGAVRVAIYAGASPEAIKQTIASALGLPAGAELVVRDRDGDIVVLSDSLPDGIALTVSLAAGAPGEPGPPALIPPGPKPLPIVGNLLSIDPANIIESFSKLVAEYGVFVHLKMPVGNVYLCTDADVISDMLARPEVFKKRTIGDRSPLGQLRRHATGDGLFTAEDDEEIWHIAHRVLLPTMGQNAIKQYFPRILEVTEQLVAHLAALPAPGTFLCTDLMTRMTFETISYAGFSKRFNCIDSTEPIPFVDAMIDVLVDALAAPTTLLPPLFHPMLTAKRERALTVLRETVDGIIKERKAALARGEPVPSDMLQTMLTMRDRVTGKRLPDDNIRYQLITLLIAGHETTSGLLSYALYYLSQNPQVEERLQAEIDSVLGRDYSYRPTYHDVERLDYTLRVLKETLRLCPTAPGFNKTVYKDTVVSGKYAVAKGSRVMVTLAGLHRNPQYWGSEPEKFDPDRFLPAAEAARHPDAYHPFGIGMRSCIGFQFALVEARLVLAALYQRFRFRTTLPDYKLAHVQTLTIKPKDLLLDLLLRPEEKGRLPQLGASSPAAPKVAVVQSPAEVQASGAPLLILYGSNMGTGQDVAQALARQAVRQGFSPTVAELDAGCAGLPTGGPLLIVTSTYNGSPPDNAGKFAAWLESAPAGSLKGVVYAVLGLGNRQWRNTFQKFPRYVHERLGALGAEPFYALGSADADADFDAAIEAWLGGLWPAVAAKFDRAAAPAPSADEQSPILYAVEVVNFAGAQAGAVLPSKYPLHEESCLGIVTRNVELQASSSERSTRHLEIELPDGIHYAAGDHLGVFPENSYDQVQAVAGRCGLRVADVVILRELASAGGGAGPSEPAGAGHLPCGVPITVHDLLTYHVDLAGPVTRKELRALAQSCPCPPEKAKLLLWTGADAFKTEVLDQKLTLLDLLQRFPSVPCSLELVLSLRPLIKPRYYSISSSPRRLPRSCSITVAVHGFTGPAGEHRSGVGSHYLYRCTPGTQIRMLVKDTRSSFRLPAEPDKDVILIGPGTGLAPLRGFLQERAALRADGTRVGRTLLFFGCRKSSEDFIYREELEQHHKAGELAGLYVAFSREPGQGRVYVQDLLRQHGGLVAEALQAGGSVLVCGDARHMAPDVQRALVEILAAHHGLAPELAEARLEELKAQGRYLQDVWASS